MAGGRSIKAGKQHKVNPQRQDEAKGPQQEKQVNQESGEKPKRKRQKLS